MVNFMPLAFLAAPDGSLIAIVWGTNDYSLGRSGEQGERAFPGHLPTGSSASPAWGFPPGRRSPVVLIKEVAVVVEARNPGMISNLTCNPLPNSKLTARFFPSFSRPRG